MVYTDLDSYLLRICTVSFDEKFAQVFSRKWKMLKKPNTCQTKLL